jgi:hypothetical protein
MKYQHVARFLIGPLLAAPASLAQNVDWQAVQKLASGALIVVKTQRDTVCSFQRATDDRLFCSLKFTGSDYQKPNGDRVFNREAIQNVRTIISLSQYEDENTDCSKGFIVPILAAEAGGGWSSGPQPTSFAGVKLSAPGVGPTNLDLQCDRISGQNGFSVEGSAVLPLFRVPAFRPGNDHLLFKVFAEPGVGYRAGGGPFGGYTSAKALVLFGRKRAEDGGPSPYIEFQRRFPFNSLLEGDNRIAVGVMLTLCDQCSGD